MIMETELEKKVIDSLKRCDEYDEKKYSCAEDLASSVGVSTKVIRGVLSSLSQKGIVDIQNDFFRKGDTIVILKELSK